LSVKTVFPLKNTPLKQTRNLRPELCDLFVNF
jgi:hypothetical protein